MSDPYINKPIQFDGVLTKKQIFLSDGKARYIQKHDDFITQFGYSIDFNFYSGARFYNYYIWLQKKKYFQKWKNMETLFFIFGSVHVI